MKTQVYKLREILEQVDELPRDRILWLNGKYPFSTDTECIMSDSYGDLTVEGEELSQYPEFSYEFGVPILKELYEHSIDETKSVSIEDILKDFNYYVRYDA